MVPGPITVTISHSLGRDEAKRRLDNGLGNIRALAEQGGICVSARVRGDAARKLDLGFDDMGEQQLKNIARPIRFTAFARIGLAKQRGPSSHP